MSHTGTSRKLVVAFDIGTTFSGVSYKIIDPGNTTNTHTVTRFPGQDHVGSTSKIPTVIWYDRESKPAAVGAEAVEDGIAVQAEEEEWTKAALFKLNLRPHRMNSGVTEGLIPTIPPNKTIVEVFADFMHYLYRCTRDFIRDTEMNGKDLWDSLDRTGIHYVITHPNGWEGLQQSQLRTSAVLAGLIPDTDEGHSRLSFVTEGEASLHFCVQSGLATTAKDGKGVLIVDAGGGTVDISAYRFIEKDDSYEEIAAPQCLFHGSMFVTMRAKEYLREFLKNSRYKDDVETIGQRFDQNTKPIFRSGQKFYYIPFTSASESNPSLNIRAGQLKLEGSVVAGFFEPSNVLLVGGFSASDWLYKRIKEAMAENVEVSRPDRQVNKAVSDGGVSFFVDDKVKTRIAKWTYGLSAWVKYDPDNSDHKAREDKVETNPVTGERILKKMFTVILPKGTPVQATGEYKHKYHITTTERPEGKLVHILQYDGELERPVSLYDDPDNFVTVCTIKADLRNVETRKMVSLAGKRYYYTEYYIVILFGLTELKAQVEWKEDGKKKRSPAKVVYVPRT
ncbi:hypothetical protein CC1G_11148 [Coprinopsis cinerea okayama7|uniref:Actin-like ATPase domain-containing protein n=1 Tax=Coprinopsis cinerea (strain Okayama-7 / 130 / ATCC MYA-4618 / FGSC 9003) TaxID=240176 RepID=A8N4T3_COPC7|nr:hypothetical protein CC1G_11148 [Coprinopsis cinerea okayama7\|eukprot:XP_001829878.2 hypothetical protein CC1G_11148 [Coprinopsis cinerea okayama7\